MIKRKHERVDEESVTPKQSKNYKKQKTNTHAKAPSNAAPNGMEDVGFIPVPSNGENEKLVRKLAKREKRALEKSQRDESGRKNGFQAKEVDDDIRIFDKRERNGLTGKHKSKKEKREGSTKQPKGKKSKGKAVESVTWEVSEPLGGQMLDVDPVFSPDEK